MQTIKQGAFSGAAQSGTYNHGHAASMAHAAAGRRQIKSALGGLPTASAPPMAPPAGVVGASPPPGVVAAPPGMAVAPPGAGAAPGVMAPPHIQKGNFKVHIAHQLKTKMGVKVSHNAVLSAIDRQAAGGGFTPFQAQELKNHNGPLQGVEGKQTMTKIAMEILKPTQPVLK